MRSISWGQVATIALGVTAGVLLLGVTGRILGRV